MAESNENSSPTPRRPTALVQGGLLSAGVLVLLALLAMVNYLSLRHYKRFDLTGSKLYTLSEKSLNVARQVDKDIDLVLVMSPASQSYTAVNELLDRYAAANPEHLRKRELDPGRNLLEFQQLVQAFGIDRQNVLVVAAKNPDGTVRDKRVIDEYELSEIDYSGAQFGQEPTVKEFKGEKLITSAILSLVESKKPRILFTKGHGEAYTAQSADGRSLARAAELLGKDNFEIADWSSLGQTSVPAGTDLLVIAGALTNFLPAELDVVATYLDGGGRVLVFADPVFANGAVQPADPALRAFLGRYGIEIGDDIVIDPSSTLPFFGPETLFTNNFGNHPIVQSLQQTRTQVLLPLTRSVRMATAPPAGVAVSQLVTASAESWGEKSLGNLDEGVKPDPEDLTGPVSVAVAATVGGASTPASDAPKAAQGGRLVVFGDLDFASDAQFVNAANPILLINTFNWLVSRDQLVDIEGRKPETTKLTLATDEFRAVVILVTVLMPGAAVIAGIWIFLRRRR